MYVYDIDKTYNGRNFSHVGPRRRRWQSFADWSAWSPLCLLGRDGWLGDSPRCLLRANKVTVGNLLKGATREDNYGEAAANHFAERYMKNIEKPVQGIWCWEMFQDVQCAFCISWSGKVCHMAISVPPLSEIDQKWLMAAVLCILNMTEKAPR